MGNTSVSSSPCFNHREELRKPSALIRVEVAAPRSTSSTASCTDYPRDAGRSRNRQEAGAVGEATQSPEPSPRKPLHNGLELSKPPPAEETIIMGRVRRISISDQVHLKTARSVTQFFRNLKESMFPKGLLIHHEPHRAVSNVPVGVLLRGCGTADEHNERIQASLVSVKELRGSEGLMVFGLEYRLVPCDEHKGALGRGTKCAIDESILSSDSDDEEHDVGVVFHENDQIVIEGEAVYATLAKLKSETPATSPQPDFPSSEKAESVRSVDGSYFSANAMASHFAEIGTAPSLAALEVDEFSCDGAPAPSADKLFCHLCTRRLFDIESNTMVNDNNREEFIADGGMYEAVSRLVQDHAQDIMMEDGGLQWVTVEEANTVHSEPIRVLVNSNHPLVTGYVNSKNRPTVLICTGRGKVRAGIFSRQHLICTGLESATAVPLVRDAMARELNVAIIDPNVRSESLGFQTFKKSMDFLESHFGFSVGDTEKEPSSRDLYVLSHSASGGHLVRYFLEKSNSVFLRNIRAVAFTDSTHSIQWCAKSDEKKFLFDLIQGNRSVYFRCARAQDGVAGDGNKWYLHSAGKHVQTDSFWRHRFGTIKTMWAGTNEHSMTNWFSHAKIWEHFDHLLFGRKFNRITDGAVSLASPAAKAEDGGTEGAIYP